MALNSIKNKISSVAGGEILGDMKTKETTKSPRVIPKRQEFPKEKIKKPKKENKPKKIKKINKPEIKKPQKEKTKGFNFFPEKEIEPEKEYIEEIPKVKKENDDNKLKNLGVKDVVEGYEDVLSILGIQEEIKVDVEFTSDQLDYVEFTQTQPLGFSFDEVTDFISRTKYSMHKLESALKQREKDVVRIASEVKRVEQKMIEQNQQKELDRMIGGMTEEERLIEENMELKVQINELTRKLKDKSNNSDKIAELTKQIEILQSENDILKLNNTNKNSDKLPAFEEKEEDLFDNMLDDIGGLYDDE